MSHPLLPAGRTTPTSLNTPWTATAAKTTPPPTYTHFNSPHPIINQARGVRSSRLQSLNPVVSTISSLRLHICETLRAIVRSSLPRSLSQAFCITNLPLPTCGTLRQARVAVGRAALSPGEIAVLAHFREKGRWRWRDSG